MLSSLFGQHSFKNEMRKKKQEIRQAKCEIARQKLQLEKQKIEYENQLKAGASRGNQKVLRQSAKNIIHTCNQINCLDEMDAQLSILQSTMISITSQQSMTQALVNISRMMNRTNRMIPINGIARVGQNFEKGMTIASLKREMMDEIMKSAFEDDNDEEEALVFMKLIYLESHFFYRDNMVEIAEDGYATAVAGTRIKTTAKNPILTSVDADLEARINALRRS